MKAKRAGLLVAGAYLASFLFPNLADAQGQSENAAMVQYQPSVKTEQVSDSSTSYEVNTTPQYNGVIVGEGVSVIPRKPIYVDSLFGFDKGVKIVAYDAMDSANNYIGYLLKNPGAKKIAPNLLSEMIPGAENILQVVQREEAVQSTEFDYPKTIEQINSYLSDGYLSADELENLPNYPITLAFAQKGGHNAMRYVTLAPSPVKEGSKLERAVQTPAVQPPAQEEPEKIHSETGEALGPFSSQQKPAEQAEVSQHSQVGEAQGPFGVAYKTGAVNMPRQTLEKKLDGLENLQKFMAKPSQQIVDEITSGYMKTYWSNVNYAAKKTGESQKVPSALWDAERGFGLILGGKAVLPPFSPWPEIDLNLGVKYGRFALIGHIGTGPDFTLQTVDQQLTSNISFQASQSLRNLLTGGVSAGYLQPLTNNLSAFLELGAGISSYDIYTDEKMINLSETDPSKRERGISSSESQRVYFFGTDIGPVIYIGDAFGINPFVGYRVTLDKGGNIILNQFDGGLEFFLRLGREQKSK